MLRRRLPIFAVVLFLRFRHVIKLGIAVFFIDTCCRFVFLLLKLVQVAFVVAVIVDVCSFTVGSSVVSGDVLCLNSIGVIVVSVS